MSKKIICKSCGAEYDSSLSCYPYCGTINTPGAERNYLKKLYGFRDTLNNLKKSDSREAKSEFRNETIKQVGFLKRTLIITAVIVAIIVSFSTFYNFRYSNNSKSADLIWENQNYPKMEQMFDEEKYDELYQFNTDAILDDKPVWGFEHNDFLNAYGMYMDVKNFKEEADSGVVFTKDDYAYFIRNALTLENIDNISYMELGDDEAVIQELYKPYKGYAYEVFKTTEEEKAAFSDQLASKGYLEEKEISDYVESHIDGLIK